MNLLIKIYLFTNSILSHYFEFFLKFLFVFQTFLKMIEVLGTTDKVKTIPWNFLAICPWQLFCTQKWKKCCATNSHSTRFVHLTYKSISGRVLNKILNLKKIYNQKLSFKKNSWLLKNLNTFCLFLILRTMTWFLNIFY